MNKTIAFPLSESERQMLLQSKKLSKKITKKLAVTEASENEQFFELEYKDLQAIFELASFHAFSDVIKGEKSAWESLMQRADQYLNRLEEIEVPDFSVEEEAKKIFEYLPENLRNEMAQALEMTKDLSDEKKLRALSDVMVKNAEKINAVTGELPFRQFHELHGGWWNTRRSPVRLNWRLKLEDLAESITIQVAAYILVFLVDRQGALRLSKEGALTVETMKKLLPLLPVPDDVIQSIKKKSKKVQEKDLLPLHRTRVAMQQAGVLVELGGELVLGMLGERIVQKKQFGRMMVKMFRSYFQELNLNYFDMIPYTDEVFQEIIPYFLYRIQDRMEGWVPLEQIADLLAPKDIQEQFLNLDGEQTLELLFYRLLVPLQEYGLIYIDGWITDRAQAKISKTPLYEKFISFEFSDADSSESSDIG